MFLSLGATVVGSGLRRAFILGKVRLATGAGAPVARKKKVSDV